MNSLAYTPKKGTKDEVPATPISAEQDQKPIFPTLSMNGEQAKKAGLTKCAHGDEYEITIRLKATRIGGYDYPGGGESEAPPMEFEVLSAGDPKMVESEASENESEEEEASEGESDDESKEYAKPKGKIEMSPKAAGFTKK